MCVVCRKSLVYLSLSPYLKPWWKESNTEHTHYIINPRIIENTEIGFGSSANLLLSLPQSFVSTASYLKPWWKENNTNPRHYKTNRRIIGNTEIGFDSSANPLLSLPQSFVSVGLPIDHYIHLSAALKSTQFTHSWSSLGPRAGVCSGRGRQGVCWRKGEAWGGGAVVKGQSNVVKEEGDEGSDDDWEGGWGKAGRRMNGVWRWGRQSFTGRRERKGN